MTKPNLFHELKKRNVYRVAVTYAVVAWLLIQLASILLPTFEAPPWVMKALTLVLIIGFPIALILAWAFEMSPQGIVRIMSESSQHNQYPPDKKKPFTSNVIIGFLILFILGQFLYTRVFDDGTERVDTATQALPKAMAIAVLPLKSLNSRDEDLETFSDGLTQEIISELGKVRSLVLTPFTSTVFYKNTDRNPSQIAGELNVNFLMSGSARVFFDGDSVRLHIELIEPVDQRMVWQNTYTEKMDDAPTIQTSIARKVVENLNIELSPEEDSSLNDINTSSGESFTLFMKARGEFFKLSPEGFQNSIAMLEKAVIHDPNYSQAFTFLAWSHLLGGGSWLGGTKSYAELLETTEPYIQKSLNLDPQSSDIYLVRGNRNLYTEGLLQNAKKDVEKALEINSWPRIPTDYCICTVVSTYVALNDLDRANEVADIARKVDPGNVFILWDRGNILMLEDKIEKAQALYEEAALTAPIPFFQFFAGWSYYHGQQYEKAIEYFLMAINNENFTNEMNLAYISNAYYMLGDRTQSENYGRKLRDVMAMRPNQINLAMAFLSAVQSDDNETLNWLEKAQKEKDYGAAHLINVDPAFKPLHDHSRFIEIRRKMQFYGQEEI